MGKKMSRDHAAWHNAHIYLFFFIAQFHIILIFNIPDIYFIHNACYTIHLAPSICIVLRNPWLFPEKKWKQILVPALHTANHSTSVCKNSLYQLPELDRMQRNQLVVMHPMPDGPVPCQSKPGQLPLAQSQTISTQIS